MYYNNLGVIDKLLFNLQKCKLFPWVIPKNERKISTEFNRYSKRFLLFIIRIWKIKKKKKKKKEIKIVLLDDQLQELTTDTCEIFQLYFYKNLFEPEVGSKIIIN